MQFSQSDSVFWLNKLREYFPGVNNSILDQINLEGREDLEAIEVDLYKSIFSEEHLKCDT